MRLLQRRQALKSGESTLRGLPPQELSGFKELWFCPVEKLNGATNALEPIRPSRGPTRLSALRK